MRVDVDVFIKTLKKHKDPELLCNFSCQKFNKTYTLKKNICSIPNVCSCGAFLSMVTIWLIKLVKINIRSINNLNTLLTLLKVKFA